MLGSSIYRNKCKPINKTLYFKNLRKVYPSVLDLNALWRSGIAATSLNYLPSSSCMEDSVVICSIVFWSHDITCATASLALIASCYDGMNQSSGYLISTAYGISQRIKKYRQPLPSRNIPCNGSISLQQRQQRFLSHCLSPSARLHFFSKLHCFFILII